MKRINSIQPVSGRRNRRRANIMLFVIFILGSLFAAAVAFLAMMRVDREVLSASEREYEANAVIDTLAEEVLLSSVHCLLGQQQGVTLPGPDGLYNTPDDVLEARRRPYDEYYEVDDDPVPGEYELVRNSELLDPWALIPGRHPLVSSIEPYNSRVSLSSSDLEFAGITEPERLWDNRPDVAVSPAAVVGMWDVHPVVQTRGPMRIRRDIEPIPSNTYDLAPEDYEGPNVRRDATGCGIKDARLFEVALLGDGEPDFGPNARDGPTGNDGNCNGLYNVALVDEYADISTWTGPPAFTTSANHLTLLPCDDRNSNGFLDRGRQLPAGLRRELAARLKDDDPTLVDNGELFAALRVIQNGGMVNLRASHPTLTDNLMGLDAMGQPLAAALTLDSYAPAAHERYLRRRFMLPPRTLPTDLGLVQDMGRTSATGDPTDSDLYGMLHGTMRVTALGATTDPLWYPIPDEPGDDGVFDNDLFKRWFEPRLWNDMFGSGAGSGTGYDIRHLLTFHSTDDLLMRGNARFWNGTDRVSITDGYADYQPDNGLFPTDPRYLSPQDLGLPGFSAIELYPGYDPWVVVWNDPDPTIPPTNIEAEPADVSFFRRNKAGELVRPIEPLVPIALDTALTSADRPYRPVLDDRGEVVDIQLARMQFALHSIGHANNPTRRELATVQQYFTTMLRNVHRYSAVGADGLGSDEWPASWGPAPADGDDREAADIAAQLTANFIDFADFDLGEPGGVLADGRHDLPTRVLSFSGKTFWGFENQPFISEVYLSGGDYAVELYNPSPVPMLLTHAAWPDGFGGYKLRINGTSYAIGDRAIGGPLVLQPQGFVVLFSTGFSAFTLSPSDSGEINGLAFAPSDDVVELVRTVAIDGMGLDVVDVTLDSFNVESLASNTMSRQRDTTSSGGWLVPLDITGIGDGNVYRPATLGAHNDMVDLVQALQWCPLHAFTDSYGFESAYPTTGSLLLLLRFAHQYVDNTASTPFNRVSQVGVKLQDLARELDNGHMPIFNQSERAHSGWLGQPGRESMDGTTVLTVPWGQLVFDYFTALPLTDHTFNPVDAIPGPASPAGSDVDSTGFDKYMTYLRGNQPTVRDGGLTVEGRINLNAAPWRVLQGLPLWRPSTLPLYRMNLIHRFSNTGVVPATGDTLFDLPAGDPLQVMTWQTLVSPDAGLAPMPMGEAAFTKTANDWEIEQLGPLKASAAVAYREQREIEGSGQYNVMMDMSTTNDIPLMLERRVRSESSEPLAYSYQRHASGFLTVGELANVRNPGSVVEDTVNGGYFYAQDVDGSYQCDNGMHYGDGANGGYAYRNYLHAAAPLVALSDWVTVKGHTFTAYGTLRGAGLRQEVDKKATRFEMVFDRSNLLDSKNPDERPTIIYSLREPYQISGAD